MSRLRTVLVVTWLALAGAALPVCACAAAAPIDNCCPDAGSGDCADGDPAPALQSNASCWSIAPGAASSASVVAARAALGQVTDNESADPLIAPPPTSALARLAARADKPFAFANPFERDGSSTYLHTLRLRL